MECQLARGWAPQVGDHESAKWHYSEHARVGLRSGTKRDQGGSIDRVPFIACWLFVFLLTPSLFSSTAPSITASVAPIGSYSPTYDTAFKSNTGAIIGVIIGAVVFFVVVAAAIFHWRRKKQLAERPSSAYFPPTSSSRSILPFTDPSAGRVSQGNHPKYGTRVQATPVNPMTYINTRKERVPIIHDNLSSNQSTALGSGSQLSPSSDLSSNVTSLQPMPLPVSYPPDARAIYQPLGQPAPLLSNLPAPSEPPTQGSYAYQPHPQSIFGDQDDVPDRSGSRGRIASPPPDYWSSAGQPAL